MSLDDVIAACLDHQDKRKYRAPSGQCWREISRDSQLITLKPEYPTSRLDATTIPLELFRKLGWVEVTE